MKTKDKDTGSKGNSAPGGPAPQIPEVALENKLEAGPTPEVTGPAANLAVVEDTPSSLDLSEVKLKKFGSNNKQLVLEISASEGSLDVVSDGSVEVVQLDDGTVQIIGRKTDIKKFLKNLDAVTYTGAKDDFGDNAATITITAGVQGETQTEVEAEIGIDITDVRDDLIGTDQDDTLIGDDGMNLIVGLEGDDYLVGFGGVDIIQGMGGDDTIRGGAGADTLEGGDGFDVLQYTDSAGGVTVDLQADGAGLQSATGGDADGDVVSGFEHVYGSDFADTITGDAGRNILFGYAGDDILIGLAGDDVIRGGLGADTMEGGDGIDWLRYVEAASGVTIDLNADGAGFQSASGGEAQGDVISGFENVQGSDHDDVITGNGEANYILGFGGDDVIMAGAGDDTVRGGTGADTMDGGEGADSLQYIGSTAGVIVSLVANEDGLQSASGGDAEGDVIAGFEHVYATNHDDILTGNEARNILYGYAGTDILDGGGANDVLRGGTGADEFHFTTDLAANMDRIIDFETGLDTIVLDSQIFTALGAGALGAANFHVNTTGLAETADHRVIYESDTGKLWYDADGTGAAGAVAFAHLSSLPSIDEADFMII